MFKSSISVNGGKPFYRISSQNLNEYTNLHIEEIENYFNILDKDSFNEKELEIFKAWELRDSY